MIIKIHFSEWNSFPIDLVNDVLSRTEKAIYKIQLQDLKLALKQYPDIPKVAADASLYRMSELKGRTLLLTSSDKGSLVLTVSITALALWILQNTVGETFKEAWKESDMHSQLKDFFLTRLNPEKMSHDINRELSRSSKKADFNVQLEGDDIKITINQSDRKNMPYPLDEIR